MRRESLKKTAKESGCLVLALFVVGFAVAIYRWFDSEAEAAIAEVNVQFGPTQRLAALAPDLASAKWDATTAIDGLSCWAILKQHCLDVTYTINAMSGAEVRTITARWRVELSDGHAQDVAVPENTEARDLFSQSAPLLTGVYRGALTNSTHNVNSMATLQIELDENGLVVGCLSIEPPLYGSGPVTNNPLPPFPDEARWTDKKSIYDAAVPVGETRLFLAEGANHIAFFGVRTEAGVYGFYRDYNSSGDPQVDKLLDSMGVQATYEEGRFNFERSTWDIPKAFDPLHCPSDKAEALGGGGRILTDDQLRAILAAGRGGDDKAIHAGKGH